MVLNSWIGYVSKAKQGLLNPEYSGHTATLAVPVLAIPLGLFGYYAVDSQPMSQVNIAIVFSIFGAIGGISVYNTSRGVEKIKKFSRGLEARLRN